MSRPRRYGLRVHFFPRINAFAESKEALVEKFDDEICRHVQGKAENLDKTGADGKHREFIMRQSSFFLLVFTEGSF